MTLSKVEMNPEYQERFCVREPIKINCYLSSFIATIADPSSTQEMTHMNLVNGLARHFKEMFSLTSHIHRYNTRH